MKIKIPGMEIGTVTRTTGDTDVYVTWPKAMHGYSPARARQVAIALLTAAEEADRIDAAARARPVQESLLDGAA